MSISNREIISFLLGFTVFTFCLLFFGFIANDDVLIKSLFPTFISGAISIGALFFAYLNNEQQRKTQFTTTVEKEWIQSVRNYTSNVIESVSIAAAYKLTLSLTQLNANEQSDLRAAEWKIFSNISALKLFLNNNKTLENKLMLSIEALHKKTTGISGQGDFDEAIRDLNYTISLAHELFDSKLVSSQK